jgi:pilus assembly protein FimV
MRTVTRLFLGALLALCPLVGHSLGLGKLQVKSTLNEPLDAEIDITVIADNELKGLNVSMAPRADFEAAGAERLPLLSLI